VSWIDPVSDLLHPSASFFVVDLNIRLGASYAKTIAVLGIVNRMVPLFFVQLNVFDRVSMFLSPSDYGTVKTGA